jgi:hypothetical protein
MKKNIKTTEIKRSNIFTEIKQSNIDLIKLISILNYLIKTVNKRLIDLEKLQVCPVYDDFLRWLEEGNSHRLALKLFVNDHLCFSLKYFTGQTRHKIKS